MSKRTWNYRVIATQDLHNSEWFDIREVTYEDGVPVYVMENESSISGDTLDDLKETIENMQHAFTKPILWGDNRFPEEYKP